MTKPLGAPTHPPSAQDTHTDVPLAEPVQALYILSVRHQWLFGASADQTYGIASYKAIQ